MLSQEKVKKIARIVSWGLIAILSVISLVMFVFNYQKLEKVTIAAEKSAVAQAKNVRHYAHEYKVTKVSLDEANQKIVVMTKELELANAELTSTRNELSSLQQMNDELKADIAVLERYKTKEQGLEKLIRVFKKKNRELDSVLQVTRKELATFQPDINDLKEGQNKIKLFKNQIHLVKKNMGIWKENALQARIAAQKERDRVEAVYGNGGFLVKDGEDKSVTKFREKAVKIDVKFLNR
ncbi:MAG: hypothetical protein HQL21_06955 [Candidatus Omnitrophica bacterium]|nr:hypothetical protein [Candidatus Omnitrophota bacterium]